MMRRRDSKGKFLSEEETAIFEATRGSLSEELDFSAKICWLIWRIMPVLVILFIFIKYFKLVDAFNKILIETACGDGCYCVCPNSSIPVSISSPASAGPADPLNRKS